MRTEWLFGWKQNFCHFRISCGNYDDGGWGISLAIPKLFAVWFNFGQEWWVPKRKAKTIKAKDGGIVWLPDEREFNFTIHDWAIWLTPWGKSGSWHSKDPWWIRGIVFHVDDFLLGKEEHRDDVINEFDIDIPLPEKTYKGHVQIKDHEWKRKRWFPETHRSAHVSVVGSGIPFPGKGESEWDCGEDGLTGYGSDDIRPEAIITRGVEIVLKRRREYGGSVNWLPGASPEYVELNNQLNQQQGMSVDLNTFAVYE